MARRGDIHLRRLVSSTFKFHGYILKEEACTYLVEQLEPFENSEKEEWLNKILELVQAHNLETSSLTKEHIITVLKDCVRSVTDTSETVLNVISAFDAPKFDYNPDRKKFAPTCFKYGPPQLFDSAFHKGSLFRERYTILFHRTSRHELFAPSVVGTHVGGTTNKATLCTVEYFLSSSKKLEGIVCLGLLTQLQEGQYFLEDPTGHLRLDLSNTMYHTGLYTENCFVLAEGVYDDGVFHVNQMGLPPPELSKSSRVYFGNANVFGGPSEVSLKSSSKLLKYEKEHEEEMIVFVSDVWLDDAKVMERLTKMMQGFSSVPPVAFVLMGNFLSCQYRASHAQMLKSKLRAFSEMLLEFPDIISKSKFIFVPGPADCGVANILPRSPLPKWVTEDFEKSVPSAIFTTNPCRIQYCTKEIVVVREDLITKMCRNTIHFPTGDIPQHFAKTVVCQAHLAPLPLNVCPVYWSFDSSLHLYPLPDIIVTADKFSPFSVSSTDCQVINPGSFVDTEFSFKVYVPSANLIEDSQIPEDE